MGLVTEDPESNLVIGVLVKEGEEAEGPAEEALVVLVMADQSIRIKGRGAQDLKLIIHENLNGYFHHNLWPGNY